MSVPWFHVDHVPAPGQAWPLSREEARHATGSKRLGAGDEVVLFDGRGSVARGVLGSTRTRDGSLPIEVHSIRMVERSGVRVHLVCALPKGDRLSTLIDMTTQLGAASMTPLRCARSVVGETEARADRMRRIQIEACKQAHCPWLPDLHPEITVAELLDRPGPRVAFHPGGEALQGVVNATSRSVTLAIGPEGGWTDQELRELREAGTRIAALGETILRIETAAVAAVAAWRVDMGGEPRPSSARGDGEEA